MPLDIKQIVSDDPETNGDIDLTGGDISYTESTLQNQRDLIIARKGDLLTNPGRGVGIEDFEDDESPDDMYSEIRNQLRLDGVEIVSIKGTQINGYYKNT